MAGEQGRHAKLVASADFGHTCKIRDHLSIARKRKMVNARMREQKRSSKGRVPRCENVFMDEERGPVFACFRHVRFFFLQFINETQCTEDRNCQKCCQKLREESHFCCRKSKNRVHPRRCGGRLVTQNLTKRWQSVFAELWPETPCNNVTQSWINQMQECAERRAAGEDLSTPHSKVDAYERQRERWTKHGESRVFILKEIQLQKGSAGRACWMRAVTTKKNKAVKEVDEKTAQPSLCGEQFQALWKQCTIPLMGIHNDRSVARKCWI